MSNGISTWAKKSNRPYLEHHHPSTTMMMRIKRRTRSWRSSSKLSSVCITIAYTQLMITPVPFVRGFTYAHPKRDVNNWCLTFCRDPRPFFLTIDSFVGWGSGKIEIYFYLNITYIVVNAGANRSLLYFDNIRIFTILNNQKILKLSDFLKVMLGNK